MPKRYVTRTGRALSAGRVTRKSNEQRKRHRGQERPLPFNLQCHPKALSRTTLNPQCYEVSPWVGRAYSMKGLSTLDLLSGKILAESGCYKISYGDRILGYVDDIRDAVAYRIAASRKNMEIEIYETEN